MVTPFLSTKFFIPQPRKNHIRRQELFNLLNEGVQNKLVLISAPAGYGKTTLITSWLIDQDVSASWLSIEAGDNDYYRFFNYLLEAIHRQDHKIGESLLLMLQSSSPPAPETLVGLFQNELGSIAHDLILIVDDYHLITNLSIHADFYKLIENSPANVHFIICSRTELPFSVSKLRASGELLELTLKELSLTLDESVFYVNHVMGVGLPPTDIAALNDRTEGWLAGMQLAALSLRGLADPVGFIYSLKGNDRFIGDYLVDEVLVHIPADMQDFLLRTSVLRRLEPSLCNYVLQIENSQEQLDSIDKQRLFIIPLDDIRQWYRYHHLFGEMLYARLMRKSPEIVAGLYQRASSWHADHGFKEVAVDYSLDGNDYVRAAELITEVSLPIISGGGWNQLLNWCDRIPKTEFLRLPTLWLTYFGALINAGLIPTAAKKINEIKAKGLASQAVLNQDLRRLEGELAAVEGVIILHSKADPLQTKEKLIEARELLTGDEISSRTFATLNYGVSCFLLGEIEDARELFNQSIAWGKRDEFLLSVVMGSSYLAETMAMTGKLQKAEELFQETDRYVHTLGLQQGAVFSKTNLGLGNLYYEWNKLDEALRYITEGIRLAEQGGYLDQLLPGYAALARIQSKQGDLAGIQNTIQRAKKNAGIYGDPSAAVSHIAAMEAEIAQQLGTPFVIDNWLESRKTNLPVTPDLFQQYELTTLARVLGARGDYDSMNTMIRPMWELALRQGRVKDSIYFEVLLAKCLFMKGEPMQALAILQGALAKGEPGNFVRTFLDEGGVVVSMIKQILATAGEQKPGGEECSTGYLYFLLEEAAKDILKVSTSQPMPGISAGLASLTDHELHILHLLEAGYSNKLLAQNLNISLNTVKFHLKNIYGKLGVVNRTQAARIMRYSKEVQ